MRREGADPVYVRWGIDQPGHYRTLFGGRMPDDLVPGSTHGAGAELLEVVVTSLAAAADAGLWHTGGWWEWPDLTSGSSVNSTPARNGIRRPTTGHPAAVRPSGRSQPV
ncbi:TetR-like C-terminal domain-containing protein [Streptomyces sp. NPDC054786]